jgi:hypothetical protein
LGAYLSLDGTTGAPRWRRESSFGRFINRHVPPQLVANRGTAGQVSPHSLP